MEDDREASSSSAAAAAVTVPSGGSVKPWVLVLLFSAFLVIFLPTFSSSSRGFRPAGMKGGWGIINFVLVVFAILCGVLGRRRPDDDSDRSPLASTSSASKFWLVDGSPYVSCRTAHCEYFDAAEGNRATGIRRMRSSSSYPDLRQEAEAAWGGDGEGRQFYDDIQLYRRQSEPVARECQSFRSPETKIIPVDTVVLRRSPSRRSRSPPHETSQRQPRRRSVHNNPENLLVKEPEKSHPPPPPPAEGLPQLERHRRSRSREKLPEKNSEQYSSFVPETQFLSPPEPALATLRHRRRRSLEKLTETEAEQSANFAREKPNISPSTAPSQHRRRRSIDDIWGWKAEKATSFEKEKSHMPAPAPPPPPPPPPPPLPQEDERRSKKRSGGGAKEIASTIASFYQKKKKGSKKNRAHDDITLHLETTTSMSPASPSQTLPPPPPPPPPPSFVFSQFFSKKGGSKNRRIHSLLTSTTSTPPPPPPPPPLPPSRYSRMQQEAVTPISSPPLPPRTRRSNRQVPQPPPLPPPSPPRAMHNRKNEKSNLTRFSTSPLFTLRPHPPMPEWDIRLRIPADETRANGGGSNGVEAGGSTSGQAEATLGVTEFCPSPDVNNKADLFIARFRAGLKLEKMNSLREKERRTVQQPLPEEEEFMVVGSLFDDDDPVPT